MLLRAGYVYVPYASLESVIEENKDLYYTALRKTQRTLNQAEPDWEAWIVFFLRCLKKQKDNLAVKLQRERILAQALPPLSLTIVKLLKAIVVPARQKLALNSGQSRSSPNAQKS
ncbi:MAG TPA: hypothetical protein VFY40_03655 [Blastocatellia bacterium]|nr:hypothetical protein [Blastocatellia bacterium]